MSANSGPVTWTCVATGGTCTAAGSGDIADTVDLTAGGTLVYSIDGTVPDQAPGPRQRGLVQGPGAVRGLDEPWCPGGAGAGDDLPAGLAVVQLEAEVVLARGGHIGLLKPAGEQERVGRR